MRYVISYLYLICEMNKNNNNMKYIVFNVENKNYITFQYFLFKKSKILLYLTIFMIKIFKLYKYFLYYFIQYIKIIYILCINISL